LQADDFDSLSRPGPSPFAPDYPIYGPAAKASALRVARTLLECDLIPLGVVSNEIRRDVIIAGASGRLPRPGHAVSVDLARPSLAR
jgi:hypothetical protein